MSSRNVYSQCHVHAATAIPTNGSRALRSHNIKTKNIPLLLKLPSSHTHLYTASPNRSIQHLPIPICVLLVRNALVSISPSQMNGLLLSSNNAGESGRCRPTFIKAVDNFELPFAPQPEIRSGSPLKKLGVIIALCSLKINHCLWIIYSAQTPLCSSVWNTRCPSTPISKQYNK